MPYVVNFHPPFSLTFKRDLQWNDQRHDNASYAVVKAAFAEAVNTHECAWRAWLSRLKLVKAAFVIVYNRPIL